MTLSTDDLAYIRDVLTPPGTPPISDDAFERIVQLLCNVATVLAALPASAAPVDNPAVDGGP